LKQKDGRKLTVSFIEKRGEERRGVVNVIEVF